jgi:AraC-like DNA-binding protein
VSEPRGAAAAAQDRRVRRRQTSLVSRREGIVFERSVPGGESAGLSRIDQRIACHGVVERSVVTGRFWIFAAVTHETGLTEALHDGRWSPLPNRRVFVIPPHSVLRLRLTDVRLDAHGIVGELALEDELALAPRVARLSPFAEVPRDLEEIRASLRGSAAIDPDAGAGTIARRARRLVYGVLDSPSPVREIAHELGVAPETVSRAFRRAYRLSPKAYVHGARVSDAVLSLLTGSAPLGAGFDAGFGHASRFYEVFRRMTGNTPGQYASIARQKPRRLRGRVLGS